MSAGTCRHCGYAPVGKDAIWCPNCQGTYPNPSRTASCANRLLVLMGIGFALFFGLIIVALIMAATG